ncbi:MAG: helix-turn-helix domain-containing protein [Dermatophilaceae bacterium]
MDDFASAVFVAGLRTELSAVGIRTPMPPTAGAQITVGAKRALLGVVAATHGLDPLLRAGMALVRHVPEPALAALLAATSAPDLMGRWSRLERFLHSSHRVVVREATASGLVAVHTGPPGRPPHPAEDVVVLGLLTGLFDAVGARGLVVRVGPDGAFTVVRDGRLQGVPGDAGTGEWRLGWSSWHRPARGVTNDDSVGALDQVDVPAGAVDPLDRGDAADVLDRGAAVERADALHPDDAFARCRALVATDLGRRWSVDAVAAGLGTSRRTLQRRLGLVGGLRAVVGATRAAASAALLIGSDHPLAVVGFACGYADQPHFTRQFRHRVGMTPAAYRSAFAAINSHGSVALVGSHGSHGSHDSLGPLATGSTVAATVLGAGR